MQIQIMMIKMMSLIIWIQIWTIQMNILMMTYWNQTKSISPAHYWILRPNKGPNQSNRALLETSSVKDANSYIIGSNGTTNY